MNIKELDNVINQILEDEAKKVILEQFDDEGVDDMDNSELIKKFQALSGLIDKISNIENIDDVNFGIVINIDGVNEEDLSNSFGGNSFDEAQQKLMQGLHHDLEENGMGNNFDIDVNTEEIDGALNLKIKITTGENDLLGDKNMENINEKKDNGFGSELCKAKKDGKQKFMYEGQEFDVQEYWNKMEEEESMDEKKDPEILLGDKRKFDSLKKESTEKKIIRLNEEQMKEFLKKIISEASSKELSMDPISKNAFIQSGKENSDYLDMVKKKIKDYLSFKGNDNPEFPHQIGQGEEKAARQNTEEQDDEVDLNRGRGPQDLDYDTDGIDDNGEPGKKFQDRIEKALKGDPTMGNSQDAVGITKSDTGEKILKSMKRRREGLRKEPIYPKEAVPVKTKGENNSVRPVNENEESKTSIVKEEIEKMKKLAGYNKKTQ